MFGNKANRLTQTAGRSLGQASPQLGGDAQRIGVGPLPVHPRSPPRYEKINGGTAER